jgi:hypothetical protein
LAGKGDVNLYALFTELFSSLISMDGLFGIIVPTGVATDDGTKYLFSALAEGKRIISIFSFENERFIFKEVHHAFKFCLLTAGGAGVGVEESRLVFFARNVEQVQDLERQFSLSSADYGLVNPNTLTCPVFRSRADGVLTRKIYRHAPVLIRDEQDGRLEENLWGIRFLRLLDMSNDSGKFHAYDGLISQGGILKGNAITLHGVRYLPLYEAKMAHHYDHRWATYERDGETSRDMSDTEKLQPDCLPLPRYWVEEWQVVLRTSTAPEALVKAWSKGELETACELLGQWALGAALAQQHPAADELLERFAPASGKDLFAQRDTQAAEALQAASPLDAEELQGLLPGVLNEDKEAALHWGQQLLRVRCPQYFLGWRDICRSTDERSVIASILPWAGVGHTMPLMFPSKVLPAHIAALLANLDSLVYDFVARQKIGGTHLTYSYLKQFPTLPPDAYREADLAYIVPRVLELAYTAHDLKPFAEDLGYDGEPFPWNPDRRHQLKCELDAYYAHLYGLTRDELLYILDPQNVMPEDYPSVTFPTLKRKELAEFGEYRTQVRVMAAFDQLAAVFSGRAATH